MELDKLIIFTDVTKILTSNQVSNSAKDGAYINGLSMDGARWNVEEDMVDNSRPKEMFFPMPIICARSILASAAETNGIFSCPVYKTMFRGPSYVFSAQIRTKSPSSKWVLAGVALILDVG